MAAGPNASSLGLSGHGTGRAAHCSSCAQLNAFDAASRSIGARVGSGQVAGGKQGTAPSRLEGVDNTIHFVEACRGAI